jgi:hypothetical protein
MVLLVGHAADLLMNLKASKFGAAPGVPQHPAGKSQFALVLRRGESWRDPEVTFAADHEDFAG